MISKGLRISHLTRRFGDGDTEVVAVRDVSLSVEPGEVVLVMGPSGAGKTTLLLMVGALLKPSEGTIELDGMELSALSERRLPDIRLRHFGFIFQDFNLLSALDAQDNVAFVAELAGASRKAAREKAGSLLTQLGLGHRLHFSVDKLSGGEKQRVAIARALINRPALILADEPTANLDSRAGHETMRLLRQIAKEEGRTVVIVSHDQRLRAIADRVLWLEDGQFSTMARLERDPVCGMTVEADRAATVTFEGRDLYFCSRGCLAEFQQSPRAFLSVAPAGTANVAAPDIDRQL
jgi:putative ABC transport system ATP-binding protein